MYSGTQLRIAKFYSYFFYAYLFGLAGWWRQFARLPGDLIGMPLYITEIVLISGLLLVLYQAFSSPDWRRFLFPTHFAKSVFFPLIFILTLLIPIRVLPDYFEFGFQALRDGVLIIYLLFIPMLFWLRDQISLKLVLISMFLGQSAGVLSYYAFNYLAGFQISFLHPVANDSIAVLAIAAAFILFKRWHMFGVTMLCLAPTMLSMLFWTKRNLILGGAIVIGALIIYRIQLIRNSGRLALAFISSFILATGLLFLPVVTKPLANDLFALVDKLHTEKSDNQFENEKPETNSSELKLIQERGAVLLNTEPPVTEEDKTGKPRCNCPPQNTLDLIDPELMGPRLIHGEDASANGLMSWRLYLWKNTWSDIAEKPFWGWGFGPIVVKTLPNGRVLDKESFISGPHNAYLTVIFRLGWPLFLTFLAVPAWFFILSYKVRGQLEDVHLIALAVTIYSYFSAFFNIGFEAPQSSVPAYVLMGLLASPLCFPSKKEPWLNSSSAAH